MTTVNRIREAVKPRRGPGRPPERTPAKEQEIIRTCVRAALLGGQMPSDGALAEKVGLGERTVRDIRLGAGLNRWQIAAWIRERETLQRKEPEEVVLCTMPCAGVWLLIPLIVRSALSSAVRGLHWTVGTRIEAWQLVLTIVLWAVLGFRRFFHLDDFRHAADVGMALFTGGVRLLADSTVWRLVHTLPQESVEAFYQETAAEAVPLNAPHGEEWISMDEHVVGFFTKLKPHPLKKTRVPTRGRSYPAIRLYAPFHLWAGRFVGLVVTKATRALSQVLPTLIAEVRRLRKLAGHPQPEQVDVLLDRGAYKGTLFEQLMADPDVRFIAMARATQKNVPQWEAVPDEAFVAYQPVGEQNPNLKIAETTTVISNCRYPLHTVLIRDDTPETKQRWRALFAKVSTEGMSPPHLTKYHLNMMSRESMRGQLDARHAG